MISSTDLLYIHIGKQVRIARQQSGLSQSELARRVGFTRTSISNLENGRQKIQVHTLYTIATALNVPVTALLPLSSVAVSELINDERLPEDLSAEEREWVKRVLAKE